MHKLTHSGVLVDTHARTQTWQCALQRRASYSEDSYLTHELPHEEEERKTKVNRGIALTAETEVE